PRVSGTVILLDLSFRARARNDKSKGAPGWSGRSPIKCSGHVSHPFGGNLMRRLPLHILTTAALACAGILLAGRPPRTGAPAPQAKTLAPFVLSDAAGKPWSLADQQGSKAVVVLFLGTQCPINNSYAPRLAELHKQYQDKGVRFVAVNSNHQD